MKKNIKITIVILIGIIIGLTIPVTAQIVTRANNIAFSSSKTEKTNVGDALEELYDIASKKCKRAKTLHTEKCTQNNASYFCSATGSVGNGNTITYGNSSVTNGVLNTGDAFTCDVNGDGVYDETTERFYYVSDLYTGGANDKYSSYDSNYAVLIYYSNTIISGNTLTQNNTTKIDYDSSGKTHLGPVTLLEHIPTTTQWSNVSLKNQTRQIYTHTDTLVTPTGTISPFTYTNKAARLLTLQEVNKGCGTTNNYYNSGSIDTPTCRFLMENTKYATNDYIIAYWLDTPEAYNQYMSSWPYAIYGIASPYRSLEANGVNNDTFSFGVRPAIKVLKADISY